MARFFMCRGPKAMFERLEERRLFTGIPYSQTLADQLVANITPANNVYAYGTPTVTWTGINGATAYTNASDCSTFVTTLLETAYGFTSTQFTTWTGKSLPQAKDLYNAAIADDGFTGFSQIADVQVGDMMFIKFVNVTTDTGHCVTIDAPPVLVSTSSTGRAYNVVVIDDTGSPHSNDTRSVIDPTTGTTDTGVGRGTMRFYTDLQGNLIAYSWGTSNSSVVEGSTYASITFAKLPPASTGSFLAAGSQASWNASTHALVVSGPTSIIADPGSTNPVVTVSGAGSQLLMLPGSTFVVHLGSLALTSGATATVYDPSGGSLILDIAANVGNGVVSVDSTSTLDLTQNDMIVHGGSLSTISGLIAEGMNSTGGGQWNGKGITSSAAGANTSHLTALGVMQNTNGTTAIYPTFDGLTSNTSDVLVKYTYYGDANLDGKVDGSDYSRIDNGALHPTTQTGWANGDFNYDGTINGSDYTLIDNAFNMQGSVLKFSTSSVIAATTATASAVVAPAKTTSIVTATSFPPATEDQLKKNKFSRRLINDISFLPT